MSPRIIDTYAELGLRGKELWTEFISIFCPHSIKLWECSLLMRWVRFMHKKDVFFVTGRVCDKAQKLIDHLYRNTHIGMYKSQPVSTMAIDFNIYLTRIDSDCPLSGHPSTTPSHVNLKESPTQNHSVHPDRAAAVAQASKATTSIKHYNESDREGNHDASPIFPPSSPPPRRYSR